MAKGKEKKGNEVAKIKKSKMGKTEREGTQRSRDRKSVLFCFLTRFNYRQDLPQAALPVFRLLTGRFWGFSPRRGDTLHRSRSNLARRSGP